MGQGHARIRGGGGRGFEPPRNLKNLPKTGNFGISGGLDPLPPPSLVCDNILPFWLDPLVKMSGYAHEGHLRVIILSNYDGLESSMLHTDFRENRPAGSGEEDF